MKRRERHFEKAKNAIGKMQFPDGMTWQTQIVDDIDYPRRRDVIRGRRPAHTMGEHMTSRSWCCPLTAWALQTTGRCIDPNEWQTAAKVLGIPVPVASEIVLAADQAEGWDPNTRRLLEAKCGFQGACV